MNCSRINFSVARSALEAGVVDRLEWFRAPRVLGGDGLPAIGALGLESLNVAPMFRRIAVKELGDDLHESYERIG